MRTVKARDVVVAPFVWSDGTCLFCRGGEPPRAAHGGDVDERGQGTLVQPRLYQLIRQPGTIEDRTFEIVFLAPGAEASAFTFG